MPYIDCIYYWIWGLSLCHGYNYHTDMIKFLTIGICIYLMYRLIKPKNQIESEKSESAKVIDIDYEELD